MIAALLLSLSASTSDGFAYPGQSKEAAEKVIEDCPILSAIPSYERAATPFGW